MNEFLLILGMSVVTYIIRYPVLAYFSRISFPMTIRSALNYVPISVLTAIIVPAVLIQGENQLYIHPKNPHLIGGLVAIMISWRTNNLLLTIVIGMCSFWGWRWVLEIMAGS